MSKKILACIELASMDVKKIEKTQIQEAATKHGLSVASLERAWKNLTEYGKVSFKSEETVTTQEQRDYLKQKNQEYFAGLTARAVTSKAAGKIIKEYIFTNIKAVELFRKHNISPNQFYGWLRELDVKGTLLGRRVLDPTQYDKNHIKQVIKLRRKGYVEVDPQRAIQFTRVITVLKYYL
jgi:transposase-like protein